MNVSISEEFEDVAVRSKARILAAHIMQTCELERRKIYGSFLKK